MADRPALWMLAQCLGLVGGTLGLGMLVGVAIEVWT